MIAGVTERGRREWLVVAAIIFSSLGVLSLAVATGQHMKAVGAVLAIVGAASLFHQRLLTLPSLLVMTMFVILLIPIRRYSLPASLPISLEPYRIIVALAITTWILALLVDPRVRLRATGLEAPLFGFLGAVYLSLAANLDRVDAVGSFTWKNVSFLLSFVLVFYLFVSILRRPRDLDYFVRLLVVVGGALGALAVEESITHVNVFNHLHSVLPILQYDGTQAPETGRGGGLRVYGSSQHPIAFGAALAILIPLAVYCAKRYGQRRWWLAGVLMLLGVFATRSRTGVTMLMAITIVYLVLRWRETRRYAPALVPLVLAIHFAVPGAIGTTWQSFFPQGGLLAQEKTNQVGSGRLVTFGPVFHSEFTPNPILGEGFATRVVVPTQGVDVPLSPITDDMWLAVLAETGVLGVFMLGWLFVRSARRFGRAGKRDHSARGWLLVGAAASVVSYAVGMFTYDSFAFIQVTFLLFFVLAIGAAALLTTPEEWHALEASRGQAPSPAEGLASA